MFKFPICYIVHMKQSPVVHFEMPAKDNARAAKFYTEAFGWQMHQTGPEMGNYLLAGTTETDDNQMVKTPGNINGGFFQYKDEKGFNSPHIIIQVENIDEAIEAVKKAGGETTGTKMDIPGVGIFVSLTDPEGNCVGMIQPPQK